MSHQQTTIYNEHVFESVMIGECPKCHGETTLGQSCCGEGILDQGEVIEDKYAKKVLADALGHYQSWSKSKKSNLIQLKESDIAEYITVCPYCMNEVQTDPHMGCCGEVHSEDACVTNDGECYLESEYELVGP